MMQTSSHQADLQATSDTCRGTGGREDLSLNRGEKNESNDLRCVHAFGLSGLCGRPRRHMVGPEPVRRQRHADATLFPSAQEDDGRLRQGHDGLYRLVEGKRRSGLRDARNAPVRWPRRRRRIGF